jgi:Tetratricopeptide repeat
MSGKSNSAVALAMVLITANLGVKSVSGQAPSASVLAARLDTQDKLAKMRSELIITNAGMAVAIQSEGILGVPPGSVVMCPSTYKDGALHAPGPLDSAVCGKDARNLSSGEKVYVPRIEFNSAKDKVSLLIDECDSCNRAAQISSYKSPSIFQFPKGYLALADVGQVEDAITRAHAIDDQTVEAPENPQAPATQSLTNEDIIKLVQAKLPDSVILAKIKSSNCDFDTSPDALINMKRAGVSDSVLQAIVDTTPQPANSDANENSPAATSSAENDSTPPCGNYDSCMKIAEALLDSSQSSRALARFQQASQLDASRGDAWAGVGDAYLQMGQNDDAVAMWDKALQLGSSLAISVCHAKAMCGDTGTLLLSMKELSFVNKKGEKELVAAPSAVTSEGAVLFSGVHPAYFLNIRFAGKNYRFYYLPKAIRCNMGFVCPEPGLTQQKVIGDYVHQTLVRMAAGDFGSPPKTP